MKKEEENGRRRKKEEDNGKRGKKNKEEQEAEAEPLDPDEA